MLNPSQRFRLRRAADCWPAVRPLLQPSQHHWSRPQRQQAMQALVVRPQPRRGFSGDGLLDRSWQHLLSVATVPWSRWCSR